MSFRRLLVCLMCVFFCGLNSFAVALENKSLSVIPEPLKPWTDWVLRNHPDAQCTRIAARIKQRHCAWPGKLILNLSASGAHFEQQWLVQGETRVRLPGDKKHWPETVTLNQQPAQVVQYEGAPTLFLTAGQYRIKGAIQWRRSPQFLSIDPSIVLVDVKNNNRTIPARLEKNGQLWLQPESKASSEESKGDSLLIKVFRRLQDSTPMELLTEIQLSVSGKPREVLVGQLLLYGTTPLDFLSPLPARLEEDGRVRLQVRPGQWTLRLNARFSSPPPTSFSIKKMDAEWPEQEIWSLATLPHLRGITASGVTALDPARLELPADFFDLPTYLMKSNDRLTLEEQYRGDAAPAANRLTLTRDLWFDFDGQGATVKDRIQGTMNQGWRLQAQPDLALGRITVNGVPQVVTATPEDSEGGEDSDNENPSAGLEIRHRQLQVEAISRLASHEQLSATGWQHTFDRLSATIHLPPGWRLWHANGPDQVRYSWLSRWSLWDVFLCLLIVSSIGQLLHWRWGILAVFTMALTFHTPGAPLISWIILILCLPLLQVLNKGSVQRFIRMVASVTLMVLVLISLNFAIKQIRQALYPQLERHHAINQPNRPASARFDMVVPSEETMVMESHSGETRQGKRSSKWYGSAERYASESTSTTEYHAPLNAQTGPGVPIWHWRSVKLGWDGPVNAQEKVQLLLSPPWLTRSLSVLKVLLVIALLFGLGQRLVQLLRLSKSDSLTDALQAPTSTLTSFFIGSFFIGSLLAMSFVSWSPALNAQDADPKPVNPPVIHSGVFPSPDQLQALQDELLKPPSCAPDCVAIQRVDVATNDDQLSISLMLSAGADLGVPLPAAAGWKVTRVLLNDEVASVVRINSKPWTQLTAGYHRIVLTGPLQTDQVTVNFPLTPHNVSVTAPEWDVDGVQGAHLRNQTLQLIKRARKAQTNTLVSRPIPPFVIVERTLSLDQEWRLTTNILRVAPARSAISLRIPLLANESIISNGINVVDRHAQVTLGRKEQQISWQSVVASQTPFTLTASEQHRWADVWRLSASERWHIEYQGLNPIKRNGPSSGALPNSLPDERKSETGRQMYVWHPRSKESLTLFASQPSPVKGATTTIERAELVYRPGARNALLQLNLRVLTSLGGDFAVSLPEPATLKHLYIDGVEQTRPKVDNAIVLSLHPGKQRVQIEWELAHTLGRLTQTPRIDLPAQLHNIDVRVELPRSRWPLFVGGPDIGPAMLFWGMLCVIVAIALLLGLCIRRFYLSIPLPTWHWLLLGIGVSTVHPLSSLPIVLWFFAFEARRYWVQSPSWPPKSQTFKLGQVGLAGLTALALISLCITIPYSLLAMPNMQVVGNGSSHLLYRWYQDHSQQTFPQAWVWSLPLWVYRLVMLMWSLWLVFSLMRWARWGWQRFSEGGIWPERSEDPKGKNNT